MSRIDPLSGSAPVATRAGEEEYDVDLLPREHPAWVRDTLSVSQRARALFAQLRPIAIRVLTFWDHAVRSMRIGISKISVDASGSYRVE